MPRLLVVCGLLVGLTTACSSGKDLWDGFNYSLFSTFGRTLGKNPPELSLKQVHLSREDYFEREIFVQGIVQESPEENTFAIIDDGDGTLLVKLTELPIEVAQRVKVDRKMKVLGKLEYGKLGLPILNARGVFNLKSKS